MRDCTRAEKRAFRKMGMLDPVHQAYNEGQGFAYAPRTMPPRLQRNPYPPGKRHDAWEHGYDTADPMGDWHGRNV